MYHISIESASISSLDSLDHSISVLGHELPFDTVVKLVTNTANYEQNLLG